jgi:hypothetical protein
MQNEPDIKKTDMDGSTEVSSGAEASTQNTEPKKRGRKKGYHHSEATKAAMRRARTGVHPSKETKDKISKAKEGKNQSATAKLKMSDTRRYNFLRKALEAANADMWHLPDLVDFFKEKMGKKETMSDFAQKIYSMAQEKITELTKTQTDTAAQHAAYTQLITKIKELYDVRIKELSAAEQ